MSAPTSPRRLPHAWVLYVAGLAPALAIAVAFSLGPSPRKRLAELSEAPPARAAAILEALDDGGLPAVLEAASLPGAHRALLLDHLGRRGHAPAAPLLDALSHDAQAPEAVRSAARAALQRLSTPAASARAAANAEPAGDRS